MQFFFVAKKNQCQPGLTNIQYSPTFNQVFWQLHDRNDYPIGDNVHVKSNAFSGIVLYIELQPLEKLIIGNRTNIN